MLLLLKGYKCTRCRPSLHENTWQLLPNLKKTSTFNLFKTVYQSSGSKQYLGVYCMDYAYFYDRSFTVLFSFSKYSCSILAWPQITSSLLQVYNSKDHLVSQLTLGFYRLTILTNTTIADDTSLRDKGWRYPLNSMEL